jgi:hypothetical protein
MKVRLSAAVVVALGLAVLVVASTATAGGTFRRAALSGGASGDPDATGVAIFQLNAAQGTVCFYFDVKNLDGVVTAAHIHSVATNAIVFPLAPVSGARASGCVTGQDSAVVKDIARHPEDYYLNIHTDLFPAGAVSGILGNQGSII